MSIALTKGGRIDLGKEAPGLDKICVGLGWDPNDGVTGGQFDLDASVFMIGENKKLPADEFMIFYNNLQSPDKSIKHTGDNRTGAGDGDDEQILVDLTKIAPSVHELIFVVTMHDGAELNQNFGQVSNSYIRIINQSDNSEIVKYELDEDYSVANSIEFGKLYKRNGSWKFQAVGAGHQGDLQFFVDKYL